MKEVVESMSLKSNKFMLIADLELCYCVCILDTNDYLWFVLRW